MLVLKEFANSINVSLANLAATFAQQLGQSSLEYEAIPIDSRTVAGRRLLKAVAKACEAQTPEPLCCLFNSDQNDQSNKRWATEIVPPNPLIEIECLGRTLMPVVVSLEAGQALWQLLSEVRLELIEQIFPPAATPFACTLPTTKQSDLVQAGFCADKNLEEQNQSSRTRHQTLDLNGKQPELDLTKLKRGMDRLESVVFLTEIDGTITYVNPTFEKVYGFSPEESLGQTPRIMKSGMIRLEAYQEFWKKILDGQVTTGEIVNKTKDGRLINVEATTIPILSDQGEVTGFLEFHQDITDRKRVEEERSRLLAEMESRAHREQIIREITDKLRTAPNLEYLTKIATEELGRQLGATHAKLELGVEEGQGGRAVTRTKKQEKEQGVR